MEPGSWELHIFVSLAVILGTAFIALIVDYLKGSNEKLREHNVELRVRTEETQRRAILDPLRYAHPSILSALQSAVAAKPAATANGAAQMQQAAVHAADAVGGISHAVIREAPATLVPVAVEAAEGTVAHAAILQTPSATARPAMGGELLEQVIAATSGGTMGAAGSARIVYQEAALPPAAPPRETNSFQEAPPPPPMTEMKAPDQSMPARQAEPELEAADRVVFVTPVEVDEQVDVQSRPLLHQFEVFGRNRLRADVQEEPAAPIKLQLHTKPASESNGNVQPGRPTAVPAGEPAAPAAEPDPDDAPNEWFREPDSHRPRLESHSLNRAPEEPAMVEETEEVNEPTAARQAEPEPKAAVEPMAEEAPRTALLTEAVEEAVAVEDGVMSAIPEPQATLLAAVPEPAADFDVVYSQPVENPPAELVVPLVASFARVPRIIRPEPVPWPKPVARPEPVIFTEPAVLPKSRLKPEGTSAWSQGAMPATSGAQGPDVRVFGAPQPLEIPAGYHERTLLEDLCREDGLFSGLVIAVGINDFKRVQEGTGRSGMDPLMQSVISVVRGCTGNKGFVCRTAEDEFIIIHPNENGPAARRRLNQVSERLWDFQLRSLGVASIMFSSGSVEVEHERLSEAISSANERMYQTKRSRKMVIMDTVRQKRAVNA